MTTTTPTTGPACPVCGRAALVARLLPVCSKRCADVDLGRWLTGHYVVPEREPDDSDGSA